MSGLSFVTLLSYDYRYVFYAIRSYYEIADEILLAVDGERISWSGKPFEIDMEKVRARVGEMDVGKKIRIVEGNYHGSARPMENDTGERNELSKLCAAGNWVVQIDADEILLNAGEFRKWMVEANPQGVVFARWFTIFKAFEKQALVVNPATEFAPVATRMRGAYVNARLTLETQVNSPLQLLHFSWGRTAGELRQKLENWSHSKDFDVEAFYRFWEGLTLENYQGARNFHPLTPGVWAGLAAVELKGDGRRIVEGG